MSNSIKEIEIIPAIIPKNFDDLREKVSLVKDYVSLIQIDITDDVFVPSKSWPLIEEDDFALPFVGDVDYEIDLMVSDLSDIEKWIVEGVKRIIFHIEATDNPKEIISKLKGKVEIGIAFNINTDISKYESVLNEVDFIQFMGIEKIGFQGVEFSEKVIQKIKDFRGQNNDIIISVDGGVNLENVNLLKEVGANRLISGSTIFESDNIEETINKLKSY
jgi:ribulose-phosphate 3-epimerase